MRILTEIIHVSRRIRGQPRQHGIFVVTPQLFFGLARERGTNHLFKPRGDRNARQRLPARAAAPRSRRHVKGSGVLARDERRRGGRDCVGVALADCRVEARVAAVCAAVARDEEAAPKIAVRRGPLFVYRKAVSEP